MKVMTNYEYVKQCDKEQLKQFLSDFIYHMTGKINMDGYIKEFIDLKYKFDRCSPESRERISK